MDEFWVVVVMRVVRQRSRKGVEICSQFTEQTFCLLGVRHIWDDRKIFKALGMALKLREEAQPFRKRAAQKPIGKKRLSKIAHMK
jgi:hypothetical protein